jgi:hypothetical protein
VTQQVLTAFLGILSVVSPGKKGVREQTTVRLKLKAKSSTISAPPDIGKETLLKHCDAHFGSQWLQKWDESAVDLCHSNNGKDQRKELESLLRCRCSLTSETKIRPRSGSSMASEE